jgi:hypothetical protein
VRPAPTEYLSAEESKRRQLLRLIQDLTDAVPLYDMILWPDEGSSQKLILHKSSDNIFERDREYRHSIRVLKIVLNRNVGQYCDAPREWQSDDAVREARRLIGTEPYRQYYLACVRRYNPVQILFCAARIRSPISRVSALDGWTTAQLFHLYQELDPFETDERL